MSNCAARSPAGPRLGGATLSFTSPALLCCYAIRWPESAATGAVRQSGDSVPQDRRSHRSRACQNPSDGSAQGQAGPARNPAVRALRHVFTTYPAEKFPAAEVLEWYRLPGKSNWSSSASSPWPSSGTCRSTQAPKPGCTASCWWRCWSTAMRGPFPPGDTTSRPDRTPSPWRLQIRIEPSHASHRTGVFPETHVRRMARNLSIRQNLPGEGPITLIATFQPIN